MNVKNTVLWGVAGLVALSAGASFASVDSTTGKSALRTAWESITRTVTNIDNGAVVHLSASGADAIAALQKHELAMPTRSVATTADGVDVTITSTDAAEAKRIQEREAKGFGPGMGMGREGRGHRGGMMGGPREGSGAMIDLSSVKRTVTNVDNGVTVTMTSDKADVVTALQAGPQDGKGPKKDDSTITFSKENVDNGVKITITSTDAAKVKEIQEREAKGFGPGVGRGHGGPDAQEGSGAQLPPPADEDAAQ